MNYTETILLRLQSSTSVPGTRHCLRQAYRCRKKSICPTNVCSPTFSSFGPTMDDSPAAWSLQDRHQQSLRALTSDVLVHGRRHWRASSNTPTQPTRFLRRPPSTKTQAHLRHVEDRRSVFDLESFNATASPVRPAVRVPRRAIMSSFMSTTLYRGANVGRPPLRTFGHCARPAISARATYRDRAHRPTPPHHLVEPESGAIHSRVLCSIRPPPAVSSPLAGPRNPRRPTPSPSGFRRAAEGYCFTGASSGRGNLLRAAAESNTLIVVHAIAAALGRWAVQSCWLTRRSIGSCLASRVVHAPEPGRALPGAARPAPPMSYAGRAVRRCYGRASPHFVAPAAPRGDLTQHSTHPSSLSLPHRTLRTVWSILDDARHDAKRGMSRPGGGSLRALYGNLARNFRPTTRGTECRGVFGLVVIFSSMPPAATRDMAPGRKVAGGGHGLHNTLHAPAATRPTGRATVTMFSSGRGARRLSPLRGPQLQRYPSTAARGSARTGKWGRGGLGAGRGENRAGALFAPAASGKRETAQPWGTGGK